MKILYIAAEHVSGTLSLFQSEHRRRGDECRYVTFWHSRWNFPDDICLELPFMPNRSWVVKARQWLSKEVEPSKSAAAGELPHWHPSPAAKLLFAFRDMLNWPRIQHVISTHGLDQFDVIHLDGGLDFTRDARFATSIASRGGHIAAFYHGTDLRQRGIIPAVDRVTDLRLTSEWDLLEFDPRLEYLYLPYDTSAHLRRSYKFHRPIRVCHAARNQFKGTNSVLAAIEDLSKHHELAFTLIQNMTHEQALQVISESDIFIDQLTNEGGWGYGMSSVEALSFGLAVITNIPQKMAVSIGEHPFIQADSANIGSILEHSLSDENLCRRHSVAGQDWVRERHDVKAVGDRLYSLYEKRGWTR